MLGPLLLALAACQSPMERCVAQATESLRAAERELASAEATLARGHAIETRRRSIPIYTSCRAGDGRIYPCFRDWEQEVTVKVPVDLARVAARAETLRADIAALRPVAAEGAAQCRAVLGEPAEGAEPPAAG
ncbi:excinuclease ABC subunit B [Roseivivax sp. GX 12232]|uniref:excinuclease ABC subunit B n=1 Tax=Roseivivax sp. GX 12232 TaxID=2900547 RepID=UPI001E57802A|nr:excinuclease ABC subunit B [Roseivivax sp. GX 12232]MCE0505308.1 excinuclease ABC subunit B [Roseivivax sp. GX 12232]